MAPNNNSVKKAVFPVGGAGTRFLPATKAMPKELLPIIDKPLIQYAAEEAVSAGLDTLIFITGRNKRAIEDHFDNNRELEISLRMKDDDEQANMVRNILPEGVQCVFIRQPEPLGLGHAVLCAERIVGKEPFAVLLADDFIFSEGLGTTSDLLKAYKKSGKSQLSVMQVTGPNISNYGVVKVKENTNLVTGLVEKPKFEDAPSDLASIGRYVLKPEIFDFLRVQKPGTGGEIQLADALDSLSRLGNVEISMLRDTRFDCGSVKGYLDSIMFVADRLNLI